MTMSTCQKPSPPVEDANCEHVAQDPQTTNLQVCIIMMMGNDDDDDDDDDDDPAPSTVRMMMIGIGE